MKKLGIDARLYGQTGVGVYLRNLIHYLQMIWKEEHQVYVYVLPQDESVVHLNHENFTKRVVPYRWHTIEEQTSFLSRLNKDSLDLMHFTYFSYPVMYKKKFIATIHDLTPLLFKTGRASTQNPLLYELKYQFFKYILTSQVKNAAHIITPTETIRNRLTETYGQQYAAKITSIYEGVDYLLQETKENKNLKSQFKKPFFIYVGNFYPHKNIENLVKAFKDVKEEVDLVLVGPNDFFASRIKTIVSEIHQEERIRMYNNATREDAVFFYKNAVGLIHPSLSEGFGLPIIESVYFNLPIIASDIPVFNEILGDTFTKFDPRSVQNITETINTFLEKKSRTHYKNLLEKFSFAHMTGETYKLYRQFL